MAALKPAHSAKTHRRGYRAAARAYLAPLVTRKRQPTEAALLRELDPHLLAALTYVHAQRAAGLGIQHFMGQSRLTAAARAFHFSGCFARLGLLLVERHVLALRVGRERCSVSVSPMNLPFDRAVMVQA
jgi:hypothetical protein